MPPIKSVSSSALRAVLASSAFVKCYESVKVKREGGKCVHGCAIMYIINIRVSIRIGPLPHVFEVAFFLEVTKQYDCEYITTCTNTTSRQLFFYDTSLDL